MIHSGCIGILSHKNYLDGDSLYAFGIRLAFGFVNEELYDAQINAEGERLYNVAKNLGYSDKSIARGDGLIQAALGEWTGMNAAAESIAGYDLGENRLLDGMERVQKGAIGTAGAAFSLAAGFALGNKLVSQGAKAAVAKEMQGNITVLGHNPAYMELAEQLGARKFHMPDHIWQKMTEAEIWAANKKFLDRTIKRGDRIRLATHYDEVRKGSYLEKELEYLTSKGYKVSDDGWWLIEP